VYKLTLALRYLYRRRISYLALGAVALCVFIVIVVMTVMTGLVSDFKKKNHEFAGDCVVGTESLVGFPYYEDFADVLKSADFIEGVSPVINSYGLAKAEGASSSIGLRIMGIYPVLHSKATGFAETLHYHKENVSRAFEPDYDTHLAGCVVGVELWLNRDSKGEYVYDPRPTKTGISVTCFPLTAKGALAKAGTDLVNTKTFYFSDFSESGLAREDSSVIYIPFEDAQLLCGMNSPVARASQLHIKLRPGEKLEDGCLKVRALWAIFCDDMKGKQNAELLSQVGVQSWKENRREFIAAMEKEQAMLIVMFGLVGLTTVFIVFVVFYMIVSHKSKDLGILKSVGASGCDVVALFSGFAGIIGIIGSAAGIAGGILFLRDINAIENWLYDRFGFQLWDRTIYSIGEIPHKIDLTMLLIVAGSAVLACLAGAALPSVRAARNKPIEALQVNQL
jgi:lipoprotein-releasing system permease protein